MLYILARVFDEVARPSMLLLIFAALGVVLTWRRPRSRWGRNCLAAGIGGLFAVAVLPLSTWLMRPLEDRFPPPRVLPEKIDGIVVLGGAISVPRSVDRDGPEWTSAAARMTSFAVLARRYPDARLLFTGGNADPFAKKKSEAEIARVFFGGLGLDAVRYESASRNTHENALYGFRMMQPKPGERWLLVTSAADLPRAVGAFRAAGWPVIAYPAGYRTMYRGAGFFSGLPDGLADLDWATHEWIGLVYYRLRGWTPALFPGP